MAELKNPRFAFPDPNQPNGEGNLVPSWPGFEVEKGIDGDRGQDGIDHAVHPEYLAFNASFFVNLVSTSVVNYVHVWPRVMDE